MANHLVEVAIRAKVSARSDDYYEDTKQFGEMAREAFESGASKAQIRNLENIANSASRVADILDFIKRQTGRQERWRRNQFGSQLLERLDKPLRSEAETIFSQVQEAQSEAAKHRLGEGDQLEEDDCRRIHILLCREFIRHLSAHYLYTLGIHAYQGQAGGYRGSTDSAEDLS
jgi:hypothetical protein